MVGKMTSESIPFVINYSVTEYEIILLKIVASPPGRQKGKRNINYFSTLDIHLDAG